MEKKEFTLKVRDKSDITFLGTFIDTDDDCEHVYVYDGEEVVAIVRLGPGDVIFNTAARK